MKTLLVAAAMAVCLASQTGAQSVQPKKDVASSKVKLEVLDHEGWAEVDQGPPLNATAANGAYGDFGSFCGSICYLVSVTPFLNGTERVGSLAEDNSIGQCRWVLPTAATTAQGTCFGRTFRVSRV